MLKKILILSGILLLLILAAAIVLPMLFKDDLVNMAKEEANNSLHAKIDFGDFSLSMFSHFPDFTLSVKDVSLTGESPFEGDTLAYIGEMELAVDLMSVINGMHPVRIRQVGLYDAIIHGIVTKDGQSNWDIAAGTASSGEEKTEEKPAFNMSLQKYFIRNAHITYSDSSMGLFAELRQFNHSGSGDFTQDFFSLSTHTDASRMSVSYAGIPYLSNVEADFQINLDMDMEHMKFTFSDNEFRLNHLLLGVDGFIAMPDKEINMDITFSAKQTEFKHILSLIPVVYKRDFASVQTKGELALNGFVKGKSDETSIPGFGLELKVSDAMFKYPELPRSVKNIQMELRINNPGGDADLTVVDLKRLHAEVAGQPLNIRLHLTTPVSDPDIAMQIKSQINLSMLKEVIPLEEGEAYSGSLTADLEMQGRLSSIEKQRYDQFKAGGKIILLDMNYKDAGSAYDIQVKKMYLNFSPQYVELSSFESVMNQNDISADGKILNLLNWYFKDEKLKGRFAFRSRHLDINNFMDAGDMANGEENEPTSNATAGVLKLPENINFMLQTSLDEMIYDKLLVQNVTGAVAIHSGRLILDHLRMKALDGSMDLSGAYTYMNPDQAAVDFNADIRHVDIKKTYDTFETVQKIAPVAAHCQGKISTDLKFSCMLDKNMEPVLNSLTGKGHLRTDQVTVSRSGVFSKIASVLKMEQYQNLHLNDVNFTYEFRDGRVKVDPFDMPVGNGTAKVNGSNGFDQTLNYIMHMDLPSSDIGASGMHVIKGLVAQANKSGANFSVGERVRFDVLIGGTVLQPEVVPKFGNANGSLKETIKEQVTEKAEELKEKAEEEVKKNIREQAAKIMREAEQKAAAIRAEAGKAAEKVRSEGYANAKKIENQAKNPIAKVAAKKTAEKMRKEADNKAEQIIAEGNKKADAVLKAAQIQAGKLK